MRGFSLLLVLIEFEMRGQSLKVMNLRKARKHCINGVKTFHNDPMKHFN
jgi:hypothetical protein